MATRAVNKFLGTSYSLREVRQLPDDQLDLILFVANQESIPEDSP